MRHFTLELGTLAAPTRLAASGAMLLGLVALTGWVFSMPALTRVFPGAVSMKVNTALSIVLCGASLLMLTMPSRKLLERVARCSSVFVVLLGVATFSEYLFGWDLHIDEVMLKDTYGAYNVFPGRLSPATAIALIAIGASLTAITNRSLASAVRLGACCAVVIGAVSLVGYLWDAGELITDHWLPPVAVNTATCCILLGLGILLAPRLWTRAAEAPLGALASIEIKVLGGFIVVLSLMLVGGSFTYRTNVRFANSLEWVAHTQEVRTSLASLYGSLAGAEVAVRDYVLLPSPEHLRDYQVLVDDVRLQLDTFERLTIDNPDQKRDLDALRPIVEARLDSMTGALHASATFGLPAARAVITLGHTLNSTRDVRALTDRMELRETHLLARRQQVTAHERSSLLISLLATLAAASALFLALFIVIHREMLARREAERAVRISDRYNRSIVDSSPDCLMVLTLDGRLTQMTPQGQRLMEVDDFAAIVNSDWRALWQGPALAAAQSAVEAAREGLDGRFQGLCPTLKGIAKWWDVIVMPILGADGRTERLLAVARDISEVKRSEENLLEANRFLDSLIENLPAAVVVKDAATLRFVRNNLAFERLFGISQKDFIGKTAHDILGREQADFIVGKDREALAAGKIVDVPQQDLDTKDLGVRSFHTMKVPIAGRDGKPQYLLGISFDITERKLAERAIVELNGALEAKALQLEAINTELESFSYSISHDLRAPLRAIDGFALMIEEDYSDRLEAEGRRYLAVIRENAGRMGALIDDLLAFSRLGRLPVAHQDVNVDLLVREVVQEALSDDGRKLPRIQIGSLPVARGDRALLRQVWTNLISNAIKYSSKVPEPVIEVTGREDASESLYSIRDNGVGFDMEYVEKLFGVFHRLHRADEFSGTGVGLAIVHRVVTRHGGRVWAQGKVNDGAVFSFALPRESVNG